MGNTTDKNHTRPMAGIILAAGTGARMGRTKQLLPFRGSPILAHTIENSLASGLAPLILVLGHRAREIQDRLPEFPLETAVNPDFKSGMASSLAAGLKRLALLSKKPPLGALFLLGDQPLLRADTIKAITARALECPKSIIIPTFLGRRGNPVYFDAIFFPLLRQLSGDTGGREVIRQFPNLVKEITVTDPAVCLDIDTPEDYERLCLIPEKNSDTH